MVAIGSREDVIRYVGSDILVGVTPSQVGAHILVLGHDLGAEELSRVWVGLDIVVASLPTPVGSPSDTFLRLLLEVCALLATARGTFTPGVIVDAVSVLGLQVGVLVTKRRGPLEDVWLWFGNGTSLRQSKTG